MLSVLRKCFWNVLQYSRNEHSRLWVLKHNTKWKMNSEYVIALCPGSPRSQATGLDPPRAKSWQSLCLLTPPSCGQLRAGGAALRENQEC